MKKAMQLVKRFYPVLGSLVMLSAVYGGIKPASFFGLHQPKVPKCLK